MMTLRRAEERHCDRRRRQEAWLTFCPEDRGDPLSAGFGALESLDEDRLPPGAGISRLPGRDAEIVTYVHESTLAYEDATGRSGVIQAGEFRRTTAVRGARHRETNASSTEWAHAFQIWLRPPESGRAPSPEQRRFSAAQRRGLLCVVASPDARSGSLRLHQDALVFSAILDPGQHVIHELQRGRIAWLHVVQGSVGCGDLVLTAGDGAGVAAERAVSFTAREQTELLLLDLEGPWSADRGT